LSFYLLFKGLSQPYDPYHVFYGLVRLTCFLVLFLIEYFFFQFHHPTLCWLWIELCIFSRFALYVVIPFSYPGSSRLTRGDLGHFFSFQFNPWTLSWLEYAFHDFFYLLYMKLSQYYDSGCKLGRLTRAFITVFLVEFCFNLILQY